MTYNIVTNYKITTELKKCRYFRVNLGLASTMDKNGDRILNDKDNFAFFYNNQYKTTIYAQGNIGSIRIYIDHFIQEDLVAFYYNTEEFIFNFDFEMVKEKGIEFYLGHLIKEIETLHEDRIKEAEEKKIETKRKADPNLLSSNPGAVNYEDVLEYMKQKSKNRFV
jgi:hypothetical protein